MMQPVTEPLLETLPLDHAACFSVEGEGEMDVPAVVERLATDADASATLQALGWQGGVYRQFTCKPPAGRVGWVDISVHRFPDSGSAAEAVAYFSASRAESMGLQPVLAPTIGDSSAALAGPAVNGTEYSLYLSGGPLLYAVTGVAPDSGSDPRADIEAIATALLVPTPPVQVQEFRPPRRPFLSRFRRPWRPFPPLPRCQRWFRSLLPPPHPFLHRRQRRTGRRCRPPPPSRLCLRPPLSRLPPSLRRWFPRPRHSPRQQRGRYPRRHRGLFGRQLRPLADSFRPSTAAGVCS